MERDYIISAKEEVDYTSYQETIKVITKVKMYLKEKFGKDFNFLNSNGEIINMFYEDYYKDSDKIEFLIKVSENYADKQIVIEEDKGKRIVDSVPNSLFYYPEYEVVVSSFHSFTSNGVKNLEFIFFSDEAKAILFHEEANKRMKEFDEKEIIIFTDSVNGVDYNRKRVNELIERENVVLEETIKKDIYNSIDQFFIENQEFYQKYNIPHRRGILLYGSPGNGKTTLVKSLVGTIDAPVVYWQVNEYTTSESVNTVFDTVSNMSPAILVIEDLDSIPQLSRSTLLNVLDGATTKEGIFLIGTTNYPERIDEALINRVGRFDRTYEIKLPSRELRREYLIKRGMSDFLNDHEINSITAETEGFSFVQLSEVFRQVAFDSYHDESPDIEKIIHILKENNNKSKKKDWNTGKDKSTLGFN